LQDSKDNNVSSSFIGQFPSPLQLMRGGVNRMQIPGAYFLAALLSFELLPLLLSLQVAYCDQTGWRTLNVIDGGCSDH
jgi:hypothetical protein